jgi:alkylation response protein AidB-like acyl-CoA dehydrogenase
VTAYLSEHFDDLPFSTAEKSRRYTTGRYAGAVGLNWYGCDPTLRALMRRHLSPDGFAWAEPHLERAGALIGGRIAERAEITDRNPPRLEKYDRWGRDVSQVVMPESFEASKRDLIEHGFDNPAFRANARQAGADMRPLTTAWSYLLNQAEIGMTCALGTGADMVERLVEEFAPPDVRELTHRLLPAGTLVGETAQLFTERTGGSDLAMIETTATPDGDAWRLNGFKWFVSNANGVAFVVLAKPEGADDATRGIAPFLVLRERRDGTRNGVRIRRLKDKLGTKAVASAEVELVDAEAFLLAPSGPAAGEGQAGDGRGLARMMEMTNGARLGIAMMGLGCARRSLVEALCYARARDAFGRALIDQPLMQRKLAEMIVEVEAAQLLVFDGYLHPMRISAPLIKLRAARLGITAASDAIEIHGGNGYIEQWPVARILRDAQVNTIWEGPDNILCLDVRRAIEREDAHVALFERMRAAIERAPEGDVVTNECVRQALENARASVERWARLDPATGEARLFQLSQLIVDAYAGALLLEQAGWEAETLGTDRAALVARLYARSHLAGGDALDRIDAPAEEIERFKDLCDGALVDDRTGAA